MLFDQSHSSLFRYFIIACLFCLPALRCACPHCAANDPGNGNAAWQKCSSYNIVRFIGERALKLVVLLYPAILAKSTLTLLLLLCIRRKT